MLKLLAKLLRALNSDASPGQVSLGFVAGFIVGLTPLWSLHNVLLVFLVMVLRINGSAFLVSWVVFSGIAYLVDPLTEAVGAALLHNPSLSGLWESMYNTDLWRLSHFNNTLVLGSLTSAIVLALPLFFLGRVLIVKYRTHVLSWIRKTRLMQVLKASRLWRLYESLSGGVST